MEDNVGIIKSYLWKCDLCSNTGNAKSDVEGPDGWIKIVIEDSMLDRMLHDKCICSHCLTEIDTECRKIQQKKTSFRSCGGGGGGLLA